MMKFESTKKLESILKNCCGTCTDKTDALAVLAEIDKTIGFMLERESLWESEIGKATGACTPKEAVMAINELKQIKAE